MSNITTNENDEMIKNLTDELNFLLEDTKKRNQEMETIDKDLKEGLNDIERKVDSSVEKLEGIYAELDAIEKEAGDELDKLMMEEAEDLAHATSSRP